MISLLVGVLTAILILDCALLILLVLAQLPKKEAGMGTAFGGAATDALFGAGSGNALTKLTKYCAAIFFVLALALSVINSYQRSQRERGRLPELMNRAAKTPVMLTPPVTNRPPGAPAPALVVSNNAALPVLSSGTSNAAPVLLTPPPVAGTNRAK